MIIGDRPDVRIVYLKGSREVIANRLAARQGHYMPAALLDSQFATLERPDGEPDVVAITKLESPAATARDAAARIETAAR